MVVVFLSLSQVWSVCERVHVWMHMYKGVYISEHCLVTNLCPTLHDSMDYSLSGSSIHGIFQVRILEWVAISSSRSSRPRDGIQVSCITGRFFTTEPPGKPLYKWKHVYIYVCTCGWVFVCTHVGAGVLVYVCVCLWDWVRVSMLACVCGCLPCRGNVNVFCLASAQKRNK